MGSVLSQNGRTGGTRHLHIDSQNVDLHICFQVHWATTDLTPFEEEEKLLREQTSYFDFDPLLLSAPSVPVAKPKKRGNLDMPCVDAGAAKPGGKHVKKLHLK
jgi:hypothetical protein